MSTPRRRTLTLDGREPARGDQVRTPTGALGWWVGLDGPVEWVAYAPEDVAPMAEAFDARREPEHRDGPPALVV